LLTVPVDLLGVPAPTIDALRAAAGAGNGSYVRSADGPQPLLALWRSDRLAAAASAALDDGDAAARNLVAALGLASVDIAPTCLRNLNTPDDLREAPR
jgi:molybdopterin-guanine dinucleotide biosynthesis protein A